MTSKLMSKADNDGRIERDVGRDEDEVKRRDHSRDERSMGQCHLVGYGNHYICDNVQWYHIELFVKN